MLLQYFAAQPKKNQLRCIFFENFKTSASIWHRLQFLLPLLILMEYEKEQRNERQLEPKAQLSDCGSLEHQQHFGATNSAPTANIQGVGQALYSCRFQRYAPMEQHHSAND